MSGEQPVDSQAHGGHLPVPLGCDFYRDDRGRLVQVLPDDLLLDLTELLSEVPNVDDPVVGALVDVLRPRGDSD